MKIKRQNLYESYNITTPWLKGFAYDLEHNYLNNIRSLIVPGEEKFSTIEEKLADIKERVGFGLIKETGNEISDSGLGVVEADDTTRDERFSEQDLNKMSNILKYIEDMVKDKSYLSTPEVIGKCREEEALHFDDIKIDMNKLKSFIDGILDKHSDGKASIEDITYIADDHVNSGEAMSDDKAEYFQRGNIYQ